MMPSSSSARRPNRRRNSVLSLIYLTSVALRTAASWSGSTSAAAAAASGRRPIRRVVVVGGTHGNEYTGVWCIKALERRGLSGGAAGVAEDYPSLEISTLLGNPQAHLENKRFIHSDLNREFSEEKLRTAGDNDGINNGDDDVECDIDVDDSDLCGSEGLPLTVESLRAREIDLILGPKFGTDHPATDLVVDLHSTTSNMGITLIIPEGDDVMARAAAYVLHRCGGEDGEARILMHTIPKRESRPNLSSAARHGFTIEVGPVPQGVLRHDAVEKTERALNALFRFLHKLNGKDGDERLRTALEKMYPSGRVPCFRSAPAMLDGQMSGKIVWPSDDDNPNFPAVMVHKSLQDRDFHPIRRGDPLFVDLAGKIIEYDGSHGEEVYLIFVNEGGYYYQSSGTGIGVAVRSEFGLDDGLMLTGGNFESQSKESAGK